MLGQWFPRAVQSAPKRVSLREDPKFREQQLALATLFRSVAEGNRIAWIQYLRDLKHTHQDLALRALRRDEFKEASFYDGAASTYEFLANWFEVADRRVEDLTAWLEAYMKREAAERKGGI